MPGEHAPRAVAAESDSARPFGPGEHKRHSREHPLQRALHWVQFNLHRRVFPEQDVVLEVDGEGAELHVQDRYQLALNMVRDTAERLILRLRRE